jgi:hypothetical protein
LASVQRPPRRPRTTFSSRGPGQPPRASPTAAELECFRAYRDPQTGLDLAQALERTENVARMAHLLTAAPVQIPAELNRREVRSHSADEADQPRIPRALQAELILDQPSGHFAGTDLLVVSDRHQGELPVNAVRMGTYRKMERTVAAIASGTSPIQIRPSSLLPGFTDEILREVAILLTRPVGRALFRHLEEAREGVEICSGFRSFHHRSGKISIGDERLITGKSALPDGSPLEAPIPRFVVLAHELIHRLHALEGTIERDGQTAGDVLSNPDYGNAEEQRTITGFRKGSRGWRVSEVSEWAVASQFGISPRGDHLAWGLKNLRGSRAIDRAIDVESNADLVYQLTRGEPGATAQERVTARCAELDARWGPAKTARQRRVREVLARAADPLELSQLLLRHAHQAPRKEGPLPVELRASKRPRPPHVGDTDDPRVEDTLRARPTLLEAGSALLSWRVLLHPGALYSAWGRVGSALFSKVPAETGPHLRGRTERSQLSWSALIQRVGAAGLTDQRRLHALLRRHEKLDPARVRRARRAMLATSDVRAAAVQVMRAIEGYRPVHASPSEVALAQENLGHSLVRALSDCLDEQGKVICREGYRQQLLSVLQGYYPEVMLDLVPSPGRMLALLLPQLKVSREPSTERLDALRKEALHRAKSFIPQGELGAFEAELDEYLRVTYDYRFAPQPK